MVIGGERTNWYSDHPPACTCAACTSRNASQRKFDVMTDGRKIGRNEACPCDSGKKYKKCHGKAT